MITENLKLVVCPECGQINICNEDVCVCPVCAHGNDVTDAIRIELSR